MTGRKDSHHCLYGEDMDFTDFIDSGLIVDWFQTGSTYICNPPVTDTDVDCMFLVYILDEAEEYLSNSGWTKCGITEYAVGNWSAWRKGKLNALITNNLQHYTKFEAATELAKKRNLLQKEDRVKLFNLVVGKQHAKST